QPDAAAVENAAAEAAAAGPIDGDGAGADEAGRAVGEEETAAGAAADVVVHRAVIHQQDAVGSDEDAAAEPLGNVVGDDQLRQGEGFARPLGGELDGSARRVATGLGLPPKQGHAAEFIVLNSAGTELKDAKLAVDVDVQ